MGCYYCMNHNIVHPVVQAEVWLFARRAWPVDRDGEVLHARDSPANVHASKSELSDLGIYYEAWYFPSSQSVISRVPLPLPSFLIRGRF